MLSARSEGVLRRSDLLTAKPAGNGNWDILVEKKSWRFSWHAEAAFSFAAESDSERDAANITLPVYTPVTREDFATYGSIEKDEAVSQPVKRPPNALPQFGSLDVSFSSTALSELTDAYLYLLDYPYQYAESRSDRVLSILSARDILPAFGKGTFPSEETLRTVLKEDIKFLQDSQLWDGGWAFFPTGDKTDPFVTLHALHALVGARKAGSQVEQKVIESGFRFVDRLEEISDQREYSAQTRHELVAYGVFLRQLLGRPDVKTAKRLFHQLDSSELEPLGWIWPTLALHAKDSSELSELRRNVRNRVTQTADTAQFHSAVSKIDNHLILHSDSRTDAILLSALLMDSPKDPLAPKLVRGLLAQRKKGRWDSTQENLWVMLALQSYFKAFEKETPDFLAEGWLGSNYLGGENFQGRSAVEARVSVPMAQIPSEQTDLALQKKGPGRLYYRVGMTYAPSDARLPAEERGFAVEREISAVDEPSDVKQLENGDWEVRSGATVKVTLNLVVPERRYHVVLVDHLPAGFEVQNPALHGTKGFSKKSDDWWSWYNWYDHKNLRDDRVEVFARDLPAGVYTYSYTAAATTPGDFSLPPAKAEEMYSPEVFGRSPAGRLTIGGQSTGAKK